MFYLVRRSIYYEIVLINLNILDDDTRVRLQRGPNDYINANFVQVPWANRNYILTQVNLLIFVLFNNLFLLRVHFQQHRIIFG